MKAAPRRAPETRGAVPQIADVARLAGVSAATVSRALSNPDIVVKATRERVLAAVEQLGYTPNFAGRNLRARRTRMILVVVPDIANVFFAEVLRGVDEALSEAGYGLLIGNLDRPATQAARLVDLVLAGQVDGVLLLNGATPTSGGRSFADAAAPIVAACETIRGAAFPQVDVDNRRGARLAAEHLTALGHRRIAYVAGPAGSVLERERRRGFVDGLRAAGLDPDGATYYPGDFSFAAGVAAARRILEATPAPTAVFCANDEMAIGLMKTLLAAGRKIPQECSVMGFDGIPFSEYCEPGLTTLEQPRRQLGATAARELLAYIEGGAPQGARRHVRLPVEIVLRASTGPAPILVSPASSS